MQEKLTFNLSSVVNALSIDHTRKIESQFFLLAAKHGCAKRLSNLFTLGTVIVIGCCQRVLKGQPIAGVCTAMFCCMQEKLTFNLSSVVNA